MAAVYTRQLAAIGLGVGTPSTICTAVSGTTILRDVFVSNNSAAAQAVTLYVLQAGFTFPIYSASALASQAVVHLELRQHLVNGASLVGLAVAGAVTVLVTGYVFNQ